MMKKILCVMLAMVLLAAGAPALADDYDDMLARAEGYIASGDYEKAAACCLLAQRMQPGNELAFLREAELRFQQEDCSAASAAIDAALEVNPASPEGWRLKCRLDVLTGDVSALEEDAIFAEVCDADLTALYIPAASMCTAAGSYENALVWFTKADVNAMNEEQRGQYLKVLLYFGQAEKAERLGLDTALIRNEALDAAFENDRLTLTRADFPAVTGEAFDFPDEVWGHYEIEKPADPADLYAGIAESEFSWLSLSPSGNSGILVSGSRVGIAYYNGRYRLLYPSSDRGAADEYGNLEKLFHMIFQTWLGEEGVVYSPDGRYAAMFNFQAVLQQLRLEYDPVIFDLSTGEMILTAAYGNRVTKENAGAATTGTFSSDGRYFYYMLYGNTSEYRTALYRYDLLENRTEMCYSGSDTNYYPRLSETRAGDFVILRDVRKSGEMAGITRISRENGRWKGTEHSFDLPLECWNCGRLMCSANSGYAVPVGRIATSQGGFGYAFQRIRPDEDFAGLNRYCVLSEEDHRVLELSAFEIMMEIQKMPPTGESGGFEIAFPYQFILAAAMSPDGHYLLLYTLNYGTREEPARSRHLLMVRLADLAVREVRGVDPDTILVGNIGARFRPVIEWNTDTLIIGTSDGILGYRFE